MCEKDTFKCIIISIGSASSIKTDMQHLLQRVRQDQLIYVREFAQDEQLYPKSGRAGTVECFGVETEIFWDGIVPEVMDELWEYPAEPNGRKDRQSQIPQRHRRPPIPCGPFVEVGFPGRDENHVRRNRRDRYPWIGNHPVPQVDGVITQFGTVAIGSFHKSDKRERKE